jgi:hypothetical protein
MSDETYSQVQMMRVLTRAVSEDPRVIAALQAKDAFYVSDAGKHLSAAVHGKETWSLVDEDIKDALEAFTYNYYRTRMMVKAELLAQFREQEGLSE